MNLSPHLSPKAESTPSDYPTLRDWSDALELAWESLKDSGDVLGHRRHEGQTRAHLASYIVTMGRKGEKDVARLMRGSLDHLKVHTTAMHRT